MGEWLGDVAIRILGSVPSPPAAITVDPWIPLSIRWDIDPHVVPLYAYARDTEQGYVELKIHPESGALLGVVVIDLPRKVESLLALEGIPSIGAPASPVLDLMLWPWRETPDYREPSRRDIDLEVKLSHATSGDVLGIEFERRPVTRILQAGSARVCVSEDLALVAIVVSGISTSSSGPGGTALL